MTEKKSIKRKKILIRIGSLRHGGAEKVLITFLKNLPTDKYEIDLLLNLYSGKYLSEVPEWINILYLHKGEMITTNRIQDIPEKAWRNIYQILLRKFPKLLYKYKLKNKQYDIEFAAIHGFRDEILSSPLKSSKKIVWIHNDLRKTEFHNYTDSEIRRFFGFDKIMVISEYIQNDFEKLAINEDEKRRIVRIYNPLDTDEILTKSELEQNLYDFESNKPVFISVGTVFPQKGYDRLLRVHKRLLDEGFRHHLLIVGDGYDFEHIKKLKNELGLEETATMLGFTDNPYPYFKQADFFVLSSRYEGFPTVLYEAVTLGKPIVATDVSGVYEILKNGELGLIVENSEEGIYDGMKRFLTEPKLTTDYQNKIAKFTQPFSLENSVKKIQEIIDQL